MRVEGGMKRRSRVQPAPMPDEVLRLRQAAVRRNSNSIQGLAINVRTWAETDFSDFKCWGDWWVKVRLEHAFRSMGHTVEVLPELADITVYLFGHPFPAMPDYPYLYNSKSFNVCWFHSHPERMTASELRKYDLVFCISPRFTSEIRELGPVVEELQICTDMRPPGEVPPAPRDVVFVGNARTRLPYGRKVIRDLAPRGYQPMVVGARWETRPDFDMSWYGGHYWPYERLPELYAGAWISLNDHHESMAHHGFLSFRILDILASGGFCISDHAEGLDNFMEGAVPMYRRPEELNELVEFYLTHAAKRAELATRGRNVAQRHTFLHRAKRILAQAGALMGV